MYGIFVNKVIIGKYMDDESESFTEVIEFDNKEELKKWILANRGIHKFKVFELKELDINISVEIN